MCHTKCKKINATKPHTIFTAPWCTLQTRLDALLTDSGEKVSWPFIRRAFRSVGVTVHGLDNTAERDCRCTLCNATSWETHRRFVDGWLVVEFPCNDSETSTKFITLNKILNNEGKVAEKLSDNILRERMLLDKSINVFC